MRARLPALSYVDEAAGREERRRLRAQNDAERSAPEVERSEVDVEIVPTGKRAGRARNTAPTSAKCSKLSETTAFAVLTKCAQRIKYAFATSMARRSSVNTLRIELLRERRTNRRLRVVIDDLNAQARANRKDLDVQFTRLAQLQAEVDTLKMVLERRR